MSFQAVTWAIEQRTGSPSAKAVLWSVANYANALWFAYPYQETIGDDSEQSVDSVGRRVADLVGAGLIRRIKLKRFGRRTHDFLILRPSPLFAAPLDEILPHLPSGCDVLDDAAPSIAADAGQVKNAAADCGSVVEEAAPAAPENVAPDAAADCGSVETPCEGCTLPQSAVHATAMVRQPNMEPVTKPFPILNPSPQPGPIATAEKISPAVPAPPPLADRGEQADRQSEAWLRYERFKRDYPVKVINDKASWLWFKALSEVEQEVAIAAGPRYGRECEKLKRRPKDAHKFLRDRLFDGFRDADPKPIARNSPEGRAVEVLYEIAGKVHLLDGFLHAAGGGIWYRRPITPQLLALNTAVPRADWPVLTTRQQAGAWNGFVEDHVGAVFHRLVEGRDRAPWPWPPARDGRVYAATAPPAPLMSADDLEFAANRKL